MIGDTVGHIRVWDAREGIDLSTPETCAASFNQVIHNSASNKFKELMLLVLGVFAFLAEGCTIVPLILQSAVIKVAHWRGHLHPVTSVDLMKGHELLVSASKDMKVCLWTLTGCLVGVLGEHEWDLCNKNTWQDPHGTQTKQPLKETERLYLQVSTLPECSADTFNPDFKMIRFSVHSTQHITVFNNKED